jgi:predicted PurR-regulated permease PerM
MLSFQEPAELPLKTDRRRVIRIELSPRTIVILTLLILGLWMLTRLLPVVLVLVAALIVVGTISPAVRWLEERRIHRGLGIAIVFIGLLVVIGLFITMTIPALAVQATNLLDQEPALRVRLANRLAGSHLTSRLAELLRNLPSGYLVSGSPVT